MAYQPKSYRKFVATAATATLVAGAIAPLASAASFTDVAPQYKDAVDFVVSKGAQGLTETKFGVNENIKRVDAAVLLVKVLGLDVDNAPASGFTDVPKRAVKYVNALKEEGITTGKTKTKFDSNALITRGELAIWIQRGFELKGEANSVFTDVADRYKSAVGALVANEITKGKTATQFGTNDNAKRGDYAIFLQKAYETITSAKVESVSATNPTTLAITGTALNKLAPEDVTIAGNQVKSISAADNGKSATLTLEAPLVDGQEYKVTVKAGEESKEFTVKFTFVLADVAVTTTTLETNKDKQFLQVTLNGAVTDLASIDSLGYKIEFQADEAVFVPATSGTATTTSTTGEIDETATAVALNKSFNVKAVLTKDGKTVESKTVKVDVVSKAVPAIGEIVLETKELELTKAVVSTKDTNVVVKEVVSSTGDVIKASGLSSYASSNPEVATINATNGQITPIKAGKTTITAKAGNVIYSKEITVVNEARVATKATADAVNVAPGAKLTTNVAITDQFGEALDAADITLEKFSVSEVTKEAGVTAAAATVDGKLPVTIQPSATAKSGSYTVVVRDLTTLKNLGQFTVKVSADNTADNYKLEVADSSKGVANLAGTKTVTLNAKEFTKSGAYLQTLDAADAGFTVESANPTIATVASTIAADGKIVVTGVKVGTTQIILKKNGVQVATATITVEEVVPTIESITWKSNPYPITVVGKEITYKDIFTITETATGVDTIVEGVKLNVNTTSKVRLDLTSTNEPVLYLDKNDDGKFATANDEILGKVSATLSDSADQTIKLAATPDWTKNILDKATASKDKGTIVIKVTDNDSNTTVRATSTINVDVK